VSRPPARRAVAPLLLLFTLALWGCGDDGGGAGVTTGGPAQDAQGEPDAGTPDAGTDRPAVPEQELGCEQGEYGRLDVACGGCFCQACPMFMSDCDDDCWRLLGCLVRDCDHDPNDPDCAAALCTSLIGAAAQLRGFDACLRPCAQACEIGP
jgi:hypothetical protein